MIYMSFQDAEDEIYSEWFTRDLATYARDISLRAYCTGYAVFDGNVENFVVTAPVYDETTEIFGMVGYDPDAQNIYVAMRGTVTDTNWALNAMSDM